MLPIVLDALSNIIWETLPVFYVAGMVACFGLPVVLFLFWKKWMPLPARTLFWASRRNTPPLLLVHDSGRGEITTIHERKGEGTVMTQQGKFKILPRYTMKLPFRAMIEKRNKDAATAALASQGVAASSGLPITQQPLQTDQTQDDPPENEEQTTQQPQAPQENELDLTQAVTVKMLNDNFILDYGDWVVKRTNLIGMNLPFFVGYTGKLCLLNPEALALYEAGEMFIRTTPSDVMFNPKQLADKNIDDAFQPLLLMDPRKIQQIIYDGFDQSQLAAVVADSEELARIGQGISPRMKLILGIVVIAGLAIAGIYFLPQILGGQKQQQQTPPATTGFILFKIRSWLHI